MTNNIIRELQVFAEATKNSQCAKHHQRRLEAAKSVQLSKCSEVFTEKQIEFIKNVLLPQPKECYKNAYNISLYFEAEYVEGIFFHGITIDHAFNKIKGKYVDITQELVLDNDPTTIEYVSLGEYSKRQICEAASETKVYGGVFEYFEQKQDKENGKTEQK